MLLSDLFESRDWDVVKLDQLIESWGITNYAVKKDFIHIYEEVNTDVDLSRTAYKKLPFFFHEAVNGNFNCQLAGLTTLEGAPPVVTGNFMCYLNKLTTLEGGPSWVGQAFSCTSSELTSLKGAPKYVGGKFHCNANKLTSLEGAPEKVGSNFYCASNTKQFTVSDVKKVCDVVGSIFT